MLHESILTALPRIGINVLAQGIAGGIQAAFAKRRPQGLNKIPEQVLFPAPFPPPMDDPLPIGHSVDRLSWERPPECHNRRSRSAIRSPAPWPGGLRPGSPQGPTGMFRSGAPNLYRRASTVNIERNRHGAAGMVAHNLDGGRPASTPAGRLLLDYRIPINGRYHDRATAACWAIILTPELRS